ncbi:hypothetical protein [Sphingomonas turrisvirgatae]|uniref:hypothetical protein n=1 Tax=Sphingomonas turrisvirgatae TaxID=1888892 RepID=UPI0010421B93|nr:hypothetical protein [Sphingomonas turrisvirgatae]
MRQIALCLNEADRITTLAYAAALEADMPVHPTAASSGSYPSHNGTHLAAELRAPVFVPASSQK